MTTEPVRPPTEDDLIGPSLHRHPSGVGVVDKSVAILDALESGPATLAQLVTATGIARPTLHRLPAPPPPPPPGGGGLPPLGMGEFCGRRW